MRSTACRPCGRQRPAAIAAAIAAAVLLAACGGPASRRTFEFRGPTMGTTYSVKVVATPAALGREARAEIDGAIRDELHRINALMSTWDPESELSRFNRSSSLDPFPIAPETFDVFRWSIDIADLTGGAFDVTLAPLIEAWGFGPDGRAATPPGEATLARLREAVGTHHLVLDPAGPSVRKRRPDVRCDFSGLAPGYAADRLAAGLEARGLADFLVDVGGELVARGHNDAGQPWQIAVERPQAEGRAIARRVPLRDAAIATSGDYRNYYEIGGERLTHIIDPRTGHPIRHRLASVTVIDRLGVRADALATALMVLGPDEGMALVARLDLAAFFLLRQDDGSFEARTSPAFDALTKD
jgi:thiamine biosynthesis lipoprotein